MADAKLYELRESKIHNTGVFATQDIPAGTRVIEYVGEKISKEEGSRRSDFSIELLARKRNLGEVYVFELNDQYDIDGSPDYNTAKYVNHSCSPNCESRIIDDRIWIVAIRNITKGDEITYDYSYDLDNFENYMCLCSSDNCFGYILDSGLWEAGRKHLALRKSASSG